MLKNLTGLCLGTCLLAGQAQASTVFQEDFGSGFNDWFGLLASIGGDAIVAPDTSSNFEIEAGQARINIENDLTFAGLGRQIALPANPGASLILSFDYAWLTDSPEEDVFALRVLDASGVETDLLGALADPVAIAAGNALTNIDISAFAGQTITLLLGIGDFDSTFGVPFDQLTLDNIVIREDLAQSVSTPGAITLLFGGLLMAAAQRRRKAQA